MRCQHVDDDTQCRMDAVRRCSSPVATHRNPDQAGFAGTVYMVQVCKEHDHDPDPGSRCRCSVLPVPCRSANGGRWRGTRGAVYDGHNTPRQARSHGWPRPNAGAKPSDRYWLGV